MKIITAIGDLKTNEEIKEKTDCSVIGKDILYQEGIIETLEKNKNIDILILNSLLSGQLDIYLLINKIKKINNLIEIIIILENKNQILEKFLRDKGIDKIIYNNETSIEKIIDMINKIKNKNSEIRVNEDIKIIKKRILT